MIKKVVLVIKYDTDEATKQGIINVVGECSGAIREVEEYHEVGRG